MALVVTVQADSREECVEHTDDAAGPVDGHGQVDGPRNANGPG